MFHLPELKTINRRKRTINTFGGLNKNLSIGYNEFSEMYNMTGEHYPVLAPRSKRGILTTFTAPQGLGAHDQLYWVNDDKFYYAGTLVGSLNPLGVERRFVNMGAYVLIWPDKKYVNTAETPMAIENLGVTHTTAGTVTFRLASTDGTAYTDYTVSETAPEAPADGELWMDNSAESLSLKQYSAASGIWVSVASTYIRIENVGIGASFEQYDGVTISGCTVDGLDINSDFVLYGKGADYLLVTGVMASPAGYTQTDALTIERKVPDMDFITELDNRIWGCSSAKHEIYACKLGDPKNWNCFMGLSTDSYAVTVGTPRDFTGAATYNGQAVFFKEDSIHTIYGTQPSNFQLDVTEGRGVQKGSEKSLATVNEVLYYKSRNGICAYTGVMPNEISAVLGRDKYSDAVGGTVDDRYFVSMKDETDAWHLFVYDEKKELWHEEDATHAMCFVRLRGELFFVDADDKKLYDVCGTMNIFSENGGTLEGDVDFFAISGNIGEDTENNKYVSKLQIRAEVPAGGQLKISLAYDGNGQWIEKFRMRPTRRMAFTVPIIPKRCDTMKIKISGSGACRIYAITKTLEEGSEI